MSKRRKRKPNRVERQRRQEARAHLQFEVVVEDTASTYTCSHELARDLAWQTEHAMDELKNDIFFNQLARDIWLDHAKRAPELIQALDDFLAERERHRTALSALHNRFIAIEDMNAHEHLEPEETYYEFVRDRLTQLGTQISQSTLDAARPSDSIEF